jgi:tripartite-type tricarboxylate transporter receptor subunit TctC
MGIQIEVKEVGKNAFILIFLAAFSISAFGQSFPSKAITLYVAFGPGATTDLTARSLGEGLQELFGVPIVVENRPGARAGITAGLVSKAKPDGYTLGVVDTGVVTVRAHLFKVPYDPLKEFTPIAQYSRYIGALTVRADSPIKTIDEFITYAKAHPGLSYSSAAMHAPQQMAVEFFARCKGLEFIHLPGKGGAEANNLLLGNHVDFTAGAGQHMQFVRQGQLRNLLLVNTEVRDPTQPGVPIMKDIGCQDAPAMGFLIIAPKGLPDPIYKILSESIHQVVAGPRFQKTLANLEIPYDYKDRDQLEKEMARDYYLYKDFLEKMGVKPE